MADWSLGLDFGTSFTVAAIANGAGPRLVDVEGDGSCRLASAVLLDDSGQLVVGGSAVHQSVFAPDRFEATPKRIVGEGDVLLGDQVRSDVDLVAAVLDRAGSEARRVAGGSPPSTVVLTHPAEWGQARQETLREAARRAGLPAVELVEEPVAAALRIGATELSVGQHVVVYDFGGGTFDVAVLRRTPNGIEVAGPPGGRDPLGGEDIDQRIIDFLGSQPIAEHADWPLLMDPPDVRWRRAATGFRTEVRRAKEGLSGQLVWQLWVPGLEREVQLTRADLEKLIEADVEATLDVVIATIAAAGITPADLAGTYLIGGSSRIPMVADRVWKRLGRAPSIQDDPKTVVALGAAAIPRQRAATSQPTSAPHQIRPPASGRGQFASRLALATNARFWTSGVHCFGYLTLVAADGSRVVVSHEPDPGGAEIPTELHAVTLMGMPAHEFAAPGSEGLTARRAILGTRAFTATFDAASEPLLARIERRGDATVDATRFYQLPMAVRPGEQLKVHERLELIRERSGHRVTAESYDLSPDTALPDWSARRVAAFTALPGFQWMGQSSARLLPSPRSANLLGVLDGQAGIMHTFTVATGPVPRLARLWVSVIGGRGYSVVAILPESDKLTFRFLLGHVTITPAGPS